MSTKTIDDRLRDKAAIDLRVELMAAVKPLNELIREAEYPRANFGDEKSMPLHTALGTIQTALQAALIDRRANDAIKQFMQRVDSLQKQLDELQDISHEH